MRSPTDHAFLPLSYIILICTSTALQASAACFWPNGTEETTTKMLPCKSSGPSMCCLLNTDLVAARDLDSCTPDGLCIPSDNSAVWRGLCTDENWEDPACINLCTTGPTVDDGVDAAANVQPLTTCGDGSLCCGFRDQSAGQDCCRKRKGLFLENGKLVSTTASSSSAPTASSSASTGIPSAAAASATPTSTSSSGKNTGAIVVLCCTEIYHLEVLRRTAIGQHVVLFLDQKTEIAVRYLGQEYFTTSKI